MTHSPDDDRAYEAPFMPLYPAHYFLDQEKERATPLADSSEPPTVTAARHVLERLAGKWQHFFDTQSQGMASDFVGAVVGRQSHAVRRVLRRYAAVARLSRYHEELDSPVYQAPSETSLPSLGPSPTEQEEQEALDALQEHTATQALRNIGRRHEEGWVGWRNNRPGPLPSLPSDRTSEGKERLKTLQEAAVEQNVALIRSIPQQFHNRVVQDVYNAMTNGWPLDELVQSLRHHYGITRKRAAFIARDQNRAITARLNVAQALEAWGTDVEAYWGHVAGGETHPRMSHVAAHGTRFRLSEGCCIDGEHIRPGEKMGCKCWFSIHIPGFD